MLIPAAWGGAALFAGLIMAVTMGSRQSMGLFVPEIRLYAGVETQDIAMALAVAQLTWGVVQPLAGMIADRYGAGKLLVAGLLLLAAGNALTAYAYSGLALTFSLGVLAAAGAGVGSFSVLISAAAHSLPAEKRALASGVVNAGSSLGQFIFPPLTQKLIFLLGWVGALWSLTLAALAVLPAIWALRRRPAPDRLEVAPAAALTKTTGSETESARAEILRAFNNRDYLLLQAGFMTCGFHIAFLVTHLPGEVAMCGQSATVASWSLGLIGLANVFGSFAAAWATPRWRGKYLLFWIYSARAILIAAYFVAPKSPETYYALAVGLGLTWLATVPPTVQVILKLFGPRRLGTLFGVALLTHQIGGFFGAWFGGFAVANYGDYQAVWLLDIGLALAAALVNLPIREPGPASRLAPQAA